MQNWDKYRIEKTPIRRSKPEKRRNKGLTLNTIEMEVEAKPMHSIIGITLILGFIFQVVGILPGLTYIRLYGIILVIGSIMFIIILYIFAKNQEKVKEPI